MQDLIFAVMDLKWIEDGAFCGIAELSKLNLNYNKLTSLPNMCSIKHSLVDLEIANNNISRLNKTFLKGFKKLRFINLNYNTLFMLPYLHWIQHSVSIVFAANNKIQSLSALDTYGLYQRLNFVDFGNNVMRTFNVSLLHHMPKLGYFNLGSNQLNNIDDFRSRYTGDINLRYNPWHCGAELSWMGDEDMAFERGLICATPTCLEGKAVAEMSK